MRLSTIADRAFVLRLAIDGNRKTTEDLRYGTGQDARHAGDELRKLRTALADVFRPGNEPLHHLYGGQKRSTCGGAHITFAKCGANVPDHLTHSHHEIQRKGITCVDCYRAWLAES